MVHAMSLVHFLQPLATAERVQRLRTQWPWPVVVNAATRAVALAIALALVVNRFANPGISGPIEQAVELPAVDAPTAAEIIAGRHLMGQAPRKTDPEISSANYRLLGAMTSSRSQAGFAIFANGNNPAVAVIEGDPLAPGLNLSKVQAEQVLLSNGGRTEILAVDWGNRPPADLAPSSLPAEKHPPPPTARAIPDSATPNNAVAQAKPQATPASPAAANQ